jgi:uncharacterized membrane protein
MMGYGGFGLMGGFGVLVGLIFLVAVIALLVWGTGGLFGARKTDMPLEILRRRYAQGEITQAEFEQARRQLA